MTKRSAMQKEDATEELIDVHIDIQNMERQFKECVEIGTFLLKKNKELEKEEIILMAKVSNQTMQQMQEGNQELDLGNTVKEQEMIIKDEKAKRKTLKS